MKGVFVHSQLEYGLEVTSAEFCQGDSLTCRLFVKNHGAGAIDVSDLRLTLMYGGTKSIRDREEGKLERIGEAEFQLPLNIAAGSQGQVGWVFELEKNCPISEKSQGLCLLYGSSSGAVGYLPVEVMPHPHIQVVLSVLEGNFQFVLKGLKWNKGVIRAKLKPPQSRQFLMVNELLMGLSFDGSALVMRYDFNVKKFERSGESVGIKKANKEFEQRLEQERYLLPGGILDHDAIEKSVSQVINEVASNL